MQNQYWLWECIFAPFIPFHFIDVWHAAKTKSRVRIKMFSPFCSTHLTQLNFSVLPPSTSCHNNNLISPPPPLPATPLPLPATEHLYFSSFRVFGKTPWKWLCEMLTSTSDSTLPKFIAISPENWFSDMSSRPRTDISASFAGIWNLAE